MFKFKSWFKEKDDKIQSNLSSRMISDLLSQTKQSSDFITQYPILKNDKKLFISYYKTLIDNQLLQCNILAILQDPNVLSELKSIEDIQVLIPIDNIQITDQIELIALNLLKGHVMLQLDQHDQKCALINISDQKIGLRDKNNTENEFSVVGPKVGFVENVDININLLRRQINIPNFIVQDITIGTISKTKVVIAYIEGITNNQHIQTVRQRLKDVDFDIVFDSSQLDQLISDNSTTPFPLFISTERIDRVVYALINGQVAIMSNGSPYVITGPSTLFDFFISPEDYYLPWLLGSFFRLIRILGVLFSMFSTSVYIAVVTFHYEMIPRDLLAPLIFSRINVPFPPVVEVLFLEMTIEFLREAGARLPSKVGQTLGIVGGIVIGQAAVEAALTSNVLLIIVALSALASFTTPIYKMSNTIRFLRFPIIISAAIWGGMGIMVGICFLLMHVTRLESLGTPYTVPLYPFRRRDFQDSFLRSSYEMTNTRPSFLRPQSLFRYHPKHQKQKNDHDE
ncbi:spore germination protein [Brevibacillus sp. SYSU BS000544]|uniref:spore germination protein n=1 Tax=Brevibacillus sp. SYSU BS000544 TaxID=3416443 RepID=UPI003CE4B30D